MVGWADLGLKKLLNLAEWAIISDCDADLEGNLSKFCTFGCLLSLTKAKTSFES